MLPRLGQINEMLHRLWRSSIPASTDYAIVDDPTKVVQSTMDGWHLLNTADQQDTAYQRIIKRMYAGIVREDLLAAATAVRFTALEFPTILEVGCGSGYYSEILSHLLGWPLKYCGLDYSLAMIQCALRRYSDQNFIVGEATSLPYPDRSFDITFNGVALMHIPNYRAAITECRRVSRQWCIFHTVPIMHQRETTYLVKKAYGHPVIEIIFNEKELRNVLEQAGLTIELSINSIPYNLEAQLGEVTSTRTYVCQTKGKFQSPEVHAQTHF